MQPQFARVEKIDTLLVGNAVRSEIKDFRTALYPRQYHPSALEKPLNKRFFAYKEFFRRTCQRKNKMRLNAAKKSDFSFSLPYFFPVEPNPPPPLTVSESSATSVYSALRNGVITSWAIRSPAAISCVSEE